jgi:CheY-like chemotaxis protein
MTALRELIQEAFIDPIRSVLIVDDQYPTWAEVLNERLAVPGRQEELEARSAAKSWRVDPRIALDVVQQFRSVNPALIIDIHDVVEAPDAELGVEHLHQSDLLILDYNLEGAASGTGGELARKALRSVLRNRHFNLVVVHTQEHNLREVFDACLISLSQALHIGFDAKDNKLIDDVKADIDELFDDERLSNNDLDASFDLSTYLQLRHPNVRCAEVLKGYMGGKGLLVRLHELASSLGLTGAKKRGFALWVVKRFETSRSSDFCDKAFEGLNWSTDEERLWLRTSQGFVTFVEKDQQDLIEELRLSLEAWQPTPSRLLSSKIRHEISCNGVEVEDRTLSKSEVFAYFYQLLLGSDDAAKRAGLLRDHIDRQSESLSHQIAPAVLKFGEDIVEADQDDGGTYCDHYGVDLADQELKKHAATHYNSFVSTVPLLANEEHLDCGHVFQVGNDYWVCATPACDMQPGQNTIAFLGNSSELRPFTALRLEEIDISGLTEKHVNGGLHCFVETEPGKVICLKPLGEAGDGVSMKATWRTFVAQNDGKLTDNQIQLFMPRLKNGEIEMNSNTAHVKARLRYEYALNYVQRVGASVTRIGLGYRADSFSD